MGSNICSKCCSSAIKSIILLHWRHPSVDLSAVPHYLNAVFECVMGDKCNEGVTTFLKTAVSSKTKIRDKSLRSIST